MECPVTPYRLLPTYRLRAIISHAHIGAYGNGYRASAQLQALRRRIVKRAMAELQRRGEA